VRLASAIPEKTAGALAHFCTTTLPTPPAPIIRTFAMMHLPFRDCQTTVAPRFNSILPPTANCAKGPEFRKSLKK
jgi:hypothetical protein